MKAQSGTRPRSSRSDMLMRFWLLGGLGNLECEIMHPGDIVPHPERVRKEPISLFRVRWYVAELICAARARFEELVVCLLLRAPSSDACT